MKEQEAIKNLKEITGWPNFCGNFYKNKLYAIDMAIEVLEKQIPKQVRELNDRKDLYVGVCTVCNYLVYRNQRYCDGCGQKLDWSEQNEHERNC